MRPAGLTGRLSGVALVLLVPTMVAAVAVDPTRIGPSREYWPGNFIEFAADPGSYPVRLALLALSGVIAIGVGLGLGRIAIKVPESLNWGRLGLIAAGVGILGWAALNIRFYLLTLDWSASGEPVSGPLATAALEAHGLSVMVAILALPTLLVSLTAGGWGLQRALALPRWLRIFPMAAGVMLALSPIGFADIGPFKGFASYLFVVAVTLLSWITVLGVSLALGRGR